MQNKSFNEVVKNYLFSLYSEELNYKKINEIASKIEIIFNKKQKFKKKKWDEKDFFLITYADSITTKNQKNLQTLSYFLENYCYEFSFIHILPFFPFSSDDGFAVINYEEVDSNHGYWNDLKKYDLENNVSQNKYY